MVTYVVRIPRSLARPLILGALDGIVTTFVVLTAGVVGAVESNAILLIGVSSLFGDGFSMAASEFLSSRSTDVTVVDAASKACACLVAFVSFGGVPLLGFLLGDVALASVLYVTSLLTIASLSYVFSNHARLCQKVGEVVLVGGVATLVACLVAFVTNWT